MRHSHWSNCDPHIQAQAEKEYKNIRSRATFFYFKTMKATDVVEKRKTNDFYEEESQAIIRLVSRTSEYHIKNYQDFDNSGNN